MKTQELPSGSATVLRVSALMIGSNKYRFGVRFTDDLTGEATEDHVISHDSRIYDDFKSDNEEAKEEATNEIIAQVLSRYELVNIA